ncbi:hypothetical protein BDDG_06899 [Blastomyces dermatitidis ATCC 18188]|uniref:Uncharacterized protein n=1 Tax=Ajellomyces dermatitidis (strain ATCC 18188 / CBS 674.68) TaxID=653446 RepID=F2TL41_AJEDA|nr:hypothetical protein BDDG_06899 [Blastomyces dermatitidis ATCC 18188]
MGYDIVAADDQNGKSTGQSKLSRKQRLHYLKLVDANFGPGFDAIGHYEGRHRAETCC